MLRAVSTLNPNFKNSTRSIGSFLKYRKGRIINGRKLVAVGYRDGSALWAVENLKPKLGRKRDREGFTESTGFDYQDDILI